MKRALFFTVLLFSKALFAESLEEGFNAYEQENYPVAVKHWRALAEKGDATAQFNLGQMYRLGKGVRQDDGAAAKWYLLAARQGSLHARHNLKMMYRDGRIDQAQLDGLPIAGTGVQTEPAVAVDMQAKTPAKAAADKIEIKPGQQMAKAISAAPANLPDSAAPVNQYASDDWQNWLPQQNSELYVVQVMASGVKQDIIRYLASHSHLLPRGRGYVRTRSKGRQWYVLLLGLYADSAAAKLAIKELPADLRKNKPWPRRVGAVSAIMH